MKTNYTFAPMKYKYTIRHVLLVLFCIVTFFANRGALPTDIMETRNMVTAREIVDDGNWLVPTMNGELRLEKPPLPTWVAAVVEKACPGNLAAQRTAPAVMGCVWTLYLFLMVRCISRRDDLASVTVVVFLTCYNVVLMGRSATWDIYCHAWMMAAIYHLTRALYGNRHCHRNFALAGLFMGLSFLSKGPVSFYALLLPYLITLMALPRPAMTGKWRWLALMAAVAIVVGGWWYAYLLVAHPAETRAVVGKESGAWTGHNVRPWWYYWRFFSEMGVWSLLMLAALAVPYWKRHITLKREYLVSATWAIASIVLLSLMPEKKMRYLLPSLAPCSMAVACLIVHFAQAGNLDRFSRGLYLASGIVVTVAVLLLPALLYRFGVKAGVVSMRTEIVASAAMLVIAGWLIWSTLMFQPMRFVGAIAVLFAFAELFLLGTIGGAFGNPGAHSIAAVRSDTRATSLPFYHSTREPVRIELVYAARKKILPLDLADTAAVGKRLPCVLVSRKWAAEEIPEKVLAGVDTISLGTFDDNKHPKGNKHYTQDFINHVTILKAKKTKKSI